MCVGLRDNLLRFNILFFLGFRCECRPALRMDSAGLVAQISLSLQEILLHDPSILLHHAVLLLIITQCISALSRAKERLVGHV